MTAVSTVFSPVDSTELGFTLMHEHIVHQGPLIRNYPDLFGPRIIDMLCINGPRRFFEGQ